MAGIGAATAIVVGVIAIWHEADPFLRSDPPPYVGHLAYDQLADEVNAIKSDQQMMTEALKQLSETSDRREYDAWVSRLEAAEIRLKADPRDQVAIDMKRLAQQKVEELSRQLGLALGR